MCVCTVKKAWINVNELLDIMLQHYGCVIQRIDLVRLFALQLLFRVCLCLLKCHPLLCILR